MAGLGALTSHLKFTEAAFLLEFLQKKSDISKILIKYNCNLRLFLLNSVERTQAVILVNSCPAGFMRITFVIIFFTFVFCH